MAGSVAIGYCQTGPFSYCQGIKLVIDHRTAEQEGVGGRRPDYLWGEGGGPLYWVLWLGNTTVMFNCVTALQWEIVGVVCIALVDGKSIGNIVCTLLNG